MTKDQNDVAALDGPTLNGHPVLSIEDAKQWFKEVGCDPKTEAVVSLVKKLNELEFVGRLWKNTPAFRALRRSNPSYLRHVRVARALETLRSDIPNIIDDSLRTRSPIERSEWKHPMTTLLDYAILVAAAFQKFLPRGRGREPELWHNVARKIATDITEILEASGRRPAGLGKPTSPAVKVARSALAYFGINKSEEAIVEAIRPKRRRSIKRLGK